MLLLQEVDPHDSLQFFRIRGKNFEYLVVLEKDYTMIGIQVGLGWIMGVRERSGDGQHHDWNAGWIYVEDESQLAVLW